jgi:hypothetical protein
VTIHHLVPGSGEGQHTGTGGGFHRMARREAHETGSPSLLVTVFYYRRPRGSAGEGASYMITGVQARQTASARASLPLSAAPDTWR